MAAQNVFTLSKMLIMFLAFLRRGVDWCRSTNRHILCHFLRRFRSETKLAYAMDGLIALDDAENSVTSWDDDRLVKFEFDHETTILHFL